MNTKYLYVALWLALAFLFSSLLPAKAAPIVYMTGAGDPWALTAAGSNDEAMDTAFGAPGWVKKLGFSANLIAADTRFVFLDGSDQNAGQLKGFLTSNQLLINQFVNQGGSLFINAAPNQGSSFGLGFGASLTLPQYISNAHATAAGVATGVFDGIAKTYTGNSFAHGFVTAGPGYVSYMDDNAGHSLFGGMAVGQGFVAFGSMTLPYWHHEADSARLLANMLDFLAAEGSAPVAVPEPSSAALFGLGLAVVLLAPLLRRRRALPAAAA